ncbi:carbonate dehydratase [Rhodopseudomonas sp. AAP120]|uniref:carbonic anhydrase n=1 Tax=Rhodopseudomonas sp. AAP120 TaxID=1523430 RepID=UPI0006B8FB6F|nr:carbonic anhydrase [Rhodopseudomonas sp. AAP120]KPF94449.1 carbonate dehydratase [Rhodopseudomonas sp. AAP120]
MDRRAILKAFAGLALCPLCATAGVAAEGAHHWGYEGDSGPAKWGELDSANQICSIGVQQSPIDIGVTVSANLYPIETEWTGKVDTIVNNGHTIQVNVADDSKLKLGGVTFKLVQFHFHHPSEHLIDGKNFPMEVHFVHRAESGTLGVLGVLMQQGKANPTFAKIVATMPQSEGPAVKADAAIDPNALLPEKRAYYRYEGSLTTPPCSEVVDWMVLANPITVAEEDIATFAKLYPMNARPPQKDNRRFVLQSN